MSALLPTGEVYSSFVIFCNGLFILVRGVFLYEGGGVVMYVFLNFVYMRLVSCTFFVGI